MVELIENLENLAGKLPGSLKRTVLNEIRPVKELFLLQRPPRFLILGDPAADMEAMWAALAGQPGPSILKGPSLSEAATLQFANGGRLQVMDRRGADPGVVHAPPDAPDLILFLTTESTPAESMDTWLAGLDQLLAETEDAPPPPVLAILLATAPEPPALPAPQASAPESPAVSPPVPISTGRESLRQSLHFRVEQSPLRRARLARTLLVDPFVRFTREGGIDPDRDERFNVDLLGAIIAHELPNEARLEFARLTNNRQAQHEIAALLVRSVTGLCGVIGTQPIPLADLPVLTSLQAAMVSGIIYISGRKAGFRAAAEFMTALGANIGVAFLARESSRFFLRFIPFWGHLVSGVIAGAATYAIGRAATAYFIDGRGIEEARGIFQRLKRRKKNVPLLEDATPPRS